MPSFTIPSSCIRPLSSPAQFYSHLLSLSRSCSERISLASLYVGTGSREQDLVRAIAERCVATSKNERPLDVSIQLDYCRALRHMQPLAGPPSVKSVGLSSAGTADVLKYNSSCQLLLELLRSSPQQAKVGLTLMPAQRGILGRLLPPRWVEGAGVFHLKAYAFDDSVILTGANLSEDYFTNRQDRYVLIRGDRDFANYTHRLVRAVRVLPGSHQLYEDGIVRANGGVDAAASSTSAKMKGIHEGSTREGVIFDPRLLPSKISHASALTPSQHEAFNAALIKTCQRFSAAPASPLPSPGTPSKEEGSSTRPPPGSAILRPRMQLGCLGVRHDETELLRLLKHVGPAPVESTSTARAPIGGPPTSDVLHLATGYFNLPPRYMRVLASGMDPQSSCHILTAAPEANGFNTGAGMSGALPMGYSEIAFAFYKMLQKAGRVPKRDPRLASAVPGVSIYEYKRPNWTFHGKGLWLLRKQTAVVGGIAHTSMISYVGSSNFGRRSVDRDIELQVEIDTADAALIQRLCDERDTLFGSTSRSLRVGAKEAKQESEDAVLSPPPAAAAADWVQPIGPHLGNAQDVWARPERRPSGWLWKSGLWIHLGWRVFAPFM